MNSRKILAQAGECLRSEVMAENQCSVHYEGAKVLTSYGRNAAIVSGGKVYLVKGVWGYSRTTKRYVSKFLGGVSPSEINQSIDDGEYEIIEE